MHLKYTYICIYSTFQSTHTEADRDTLDWSGKKPLDYRKIRTTVSASTYSSEYSFVSPTTGDSSTFSNAAAAESGGPMWPPSTVPRRTRTNELRGTFRKLRTHKRFATSTGVIQRTQSILGLHQKSAAPQDADSTDGGTNTTPVVVKRRQDRKYQSFLFKNKPEFL